MTITYSKKLGVSFLVFLVLGILSFLRTNDLLFSVIISALFAMITGIALENRWQKTSISYQQESSEHPNTVPNDEFLENHPTTIINPPNMRTDSKTNKQADPRQNKVCSACAHKLQEGVTRCPNCNHREVVDLAPDVVHDYLSKAKDVLETYKEKK